MQVEYKTLSLETLGDARFRELFREELQALIAVLDDPRAVNSKGVVSGTMTLTINLEHVLDTGSMNIGTSLKVKPPSLKGCFQAGITRGHDVLVPIEDEDDRQTNLIDMTTDA